MKTVAILSALLAVGLAEEAKLLATPLTYAGLPYTVAAPAKVEVKTVEAPAVTYATAPAITYAAAPAVAAAPVIAAAPYTAGSQFHAQDEFGNLNYGYANINSAKQEVGNTYGGVSGGYSYVDAN